MTPNFDRIARPYRWLEYLSLGPALSHSRTHHLASGALDQCRHALILGDGDGRFTAQLLPRNPKLTAEVVDCSPAMLQLLTRRCAPYAQRLTTHCTDARTHTPTLSPDLIVTHFFLDCLTQPEVEALIARLPRAPIWLISEFRIPTGPLRLPSQAFIRLLYLAFRILTGLEVSHLPDYATPLTLAGFQLTDERRLLFGILTTQLWSRRNLNHCAASL
jgi:hypothetical protein